MAVDYLPTIGSVLETRGSLRPICDMSDAVKGIWERVLVRLLNEVTARRQSLPSPQTPQNRLVVTRPRLDREPGRPKQKYKWSANPPSILALGFSGGNAPFEGPMTDQYCSQPECAGTEVLPNSYRALWLRTGCGVSLEIRGAPWQLSLHNREELAFPNQAIWYRLNLLNSTGYFSWSSQRFIWEPWRPFSPFTGLQSSCFSQCGS